MPPVIYLIDFDDQVALVDAGTGRGQTRLLDHLKKIGVRHNQIQYLLLTHCHYDHTGGALICAINWAVRSLLMSWMRAFWSKATMKPPPPVGMAPNSSLLSGRPPLERIAANLPVRKPLDHGAAHPWPLAGIAGFPDGIGRPNRIVWARRAWTLGRPPAFPVGLIIGLRSNSC